jgi:hexosaminidase
MKSRIEIKTNEENSDFISHIIEIYSKMFFRKKNASGNNDKLLYNIKIENPKVMMPSGFDPKNEQYSLKIHENGNVDIIAKYQVGVLRAMDSISQLIDYSGDQVTLNSLPITIQDEPRYGYRGFMLDVSREYYPVDTIKQIIDGLRMSKINVLHLHLTDDDSFPIQLPSFEGLTDKAAFSSKEVYTLDDIKDLIAYSTQNGIKLIPEIDIPAHTRSIGKDPRFTKLLT